MNDFLVSVYIPTKNRSALLKRAIESVLKQTYKNIEIVVCSDYSTDDTDLVMAGFVSQNRNIKYIRNKVSKGACYTRNQAIQHCSGDYITGLDDDDYFSKNRILDFIQNIKDNPNCILFSTYKIIRNSEEIKTSPQGRVLISDLMKKNMIGNQIFIKKDLAIKAGLFDENLPAWQDYEFWIRILISNGEALCLDNYSYTVDMSHEHERISKNPQKVTSAYNYIIKKHADLIHLYGDFFLLTKMRYGVVSVSLADWKAAFKTAGLTATLKLFMSRNTPAVYGYLRTLLR